VLAKIFVPALNKVDRERKIVSYIKRNFVICTGHQRRNIWASISDRLRQMHRDGRIALGKCVMRLELAEDLTVCFDFINV
jgi:hypothetical protein